MSAVSAVPAPTASDFAVRIEGLTKRFGHVVAVDDLSLTVPRGEVFGFLGPTAPASPPPSGWSSG